MSFLSSFGAYLPERVVTNADLALLLECEPDWIREMSGIEERRYARHDESVVDMGVAAAEACLNRKGIAASQVGMVIVSSGSSDRQFPGPACQITHRLGIAPTPALDIPMASAGALFAMVLANQFTATYGHVLVVAAEKMSEIAMREPLDKNISMLFGDGAGACLVSPDSGVAEIVDSVILSDGAFTESLQLGREGTLQMNGLSVILQASRKMPSAIRDLLDRNSQAASGVEIFLMHQANQNLINRVARSLEVASEKFFCNIRSYGNTSSASMLIAATEWWQATKPAAGAPVCFAAFGAGFHWGALLAKSTACLY